MDDTSSPTAAHCYLVALGSNRRHRHHGLPQAVLGAAMQLLDAAPLRLIDAAPIIHSAPLGPSQRFYANSAAIIETMLAPSALLTHLKALENRFGARHRRRWSSRVLDLDIILWRGGIWLDDSLTVPHPAFRERGFVLHPAAHIAGGWRDPVSGLSIAQLAARQRRADTKARNRSKPLDHSR
ncbi:MAG: 2-amino-4-hydroxy-6-hydroxymethyldihydropteridine diphosphokinase [Pseudomonadota bacterium]